jgi:hypothetical protein
MGEHLPINQVFRPWTLNATWSGVQSDATGQLTTGNVWFGVMNHYVAVRLEGLVVVNAWRTIRASMCGAKSEIWRRWHYSMEVIFMEWTRPSRNTAWKSKHRRLQGHCDLLHIVYGRRSVLTMIVCISMKMFRATKQVLWGNGLWTIRFQKWTSQPRIMTWIP